eukprot:SM000191S05241  [mRNA]  locus=s191:167738:173694:- [translate_table: standard]
MRNFFSSVLGSRTGIKDFPYDIGEPYSSAWGLWTHSQGTKKEDGSPVSIFSFTAANLNDGHLAAARNGVKRLRTVRHPNVLSYLHSTEAEREEGGVTKPTIYMVTEPVAPLADKIMELNLQGMQRDEYYAWGLNQIAKAVSFLNNDCKLIHSNVSVAAVVVTPSLDWKLHALDLLSEYDGGNPNASGPMLPYEYMVGTQYKPLELLKPDWTSIRHNPPYSIDSWGLGCNFVALIGFIVLAGALGCCLGFSMHSDEFAPAIYLVNPRTFTCAGCLIHELFSNQKLTGTEQLRVTSAIPKVLLPAYQRLLASVPSRRLNSSKLIESSDFFQNKLVDTIQFMEVLNLKDSVEKDSFFRKLPNLAEQLPRPIVLRKLLPQLASALEFGSAPASALNSLLKMGSWMEPDEFNTKVLPTITRLFASTDRNIRIGLLQNIAAFGPALSPAVVDEQVYPNIVTGFSDTSAFYRELTLKSMLVLAPKLSQRHLSSSLLQHLNKLQVDEEPAIRTNTTILLGNIARHLNESTRKRVLVNAFTVRALRDGFPPARSAGVMAIMATKEYYEVSEIATRLLPSLVVLTIDPDPDVRTKAFQGSEEFLDVIRLHHQKLEAGEDTSAVSMTSSTPSASAAGLLGWAVGSLTAGKVAAKGADQGTLAVTAAVSQATSPAPADVPDPELRATSRPAMLPAEAVGNGWGETESANGLQDAEEECVDEEIDGWDELDEEPAPGPVLSRLQQAQQRPLASMAKPRLPLSSPATPAAQKSAGLDFSSTLRTGAEHSGVLRASEPSNGAAQEDDPWGSIAAPVPKSTAKALSAGSSGGRGGAGSATAAGPGRGRGGRSTAGHVSLPQQAQHVSLESMLGGAPGSSGRGRGRGAPMKLGAQRLSK